VAEGLPKLDDNKEQKKVDEERDDVFR